MSKTNYLFVEVASQRGNTQTKVNGTIGYKNNIESIRNAPVMDVLQTRIELLKLLRVIDDVLSEEYKD